MNIDEKEIKFVSAVCPRCKGNLRLDSNLETAFCQYCGAQCIVENAQKKTQKASKLEIVLDLWNDNRLYTTKISVSKEKNEQKKNENKRNGYAKVGGNIP